VHRVLFRQEGIARQTQTLFPAGGHCSTNPDVSDAAGQHGLDHTTVSLDVQRLSASAQTMEPGSIQMPAWREAHAEKAGKYIYLFQLVAWFRGLCTSLI
jgi:hypothetical protein